MLFSVFEQFDFDCFVLCTGQQSAQTGGLRSRASRVGGGQCFLFFAQSVHERIGGEPVPTFNVFTDRAVFGHRSVRSYRSWLGSPPAYAEPHLPSLRMSYNIRQKRNLADYPRYSLSSSNQTTCWTGRRRIAHTPCVALPRGMDLARIIDNLC